MYAGSFEIENTNYETVFPTGAENIRGALQNLMRGGLSQ